MIVKRFVALAALAAATLACAAPSVSASLAPADVEQHPLPRFVEPRAETVAYPDLYNASIASLAQGLDAGHFTSVDLVKAYLARIREVQDELHAIMEVADEASLIKIAAGLDAERKQGKKRSILHGIPIILKDNIATDASFGLNTTAGSFSLEKSIVPGDAPIAASLRRAGAVVLAKANMSVWAQIRGDTSQGWSPRGGFTTSAIYPGGNACSSSSGSGVAASIGLAAATLGTETSGSVVCPASRNSVVGFKPSVGLASRFGIIPISSSSDSFGPIVRNVLDAAIILTHAATRKTPEQIKLDSAVAGQPESVAAGIDYYGALKKLNQDQKAKPLEGYRIAVTRGIFLNATFNGFDPATVGVYEEALKTLEEAGATLVNVTVSVAEDDAKLSKLFDRQNIFLNTELQYTLDNYLSYLKEIPSAAFNFGGLIEFANQHPDLELPTTPQNESDQSTFYAAQQSPYYSPLKPGQDPNTRKLNATYVDALKAVKDAGQSIDDALKSARASVLVSPTESFLYALAAIAGYPSSSIPAGFLGPDAKPDPANRPTWPFPNAPIGLNFVSGKWRDEEVLAASRGFEVLQIRKGRGGYGKVLSYDKATPKTQIKDVIGK